MPIASWTKKAMPTSSSHRICWPLPIYAQPAYAGRVAHTVCPHAERAAATVLSLPLHGELTRGDVELICAIVRAAAGGR